MTKVEDIAEDQILIYDIETDSVFAPYCNLKMISYQLGLGSEPRLVDLESKDDCRRLRQLLSDPNILKVSYNGINFDDIVLMRHGFYVEPKNRHDMFLALKTVNPNLPAYGLKFVSWYYFGDWHEPQRRLHAWLLRENKGRQLKNRLSMWQASEEVLGLYCMHDVRQTAKVFRLIWEHVQRPQHWKVYNEMELAMAEPLHEMVLTAGEWLDPFKTLAKIKELRKEKRKYQRRVIRLSHGDIKNPNSYKQVGAYFHEHGIMDDLSPSIGAIEDRDDPTRVIINGYSVVKSDLVDLMAKHPIAKAVFELRDISKVIQHLWNHFRAAKFEWKKYKAKPKSGLLDYTRSISKAAHKFNGAPISNRCLAIPKSYNVSFAKTRRFQSSSCFGINFQNQNKRTKTVALVPKGWLGCWVDSRQIENVVHIWASKDSVRRAAYEADLDWNEYVWLTNQILGGDYSRKELEDINSPTNPQWSLYKTYKTIKLALNFFMGARKFAKNAGLDERKAYKLFDQVHRACPAIRKIIGILSEQMAEKGYVSDPFGHIYRNDNAQKMVIHLVQGCGTGSVPKAMTIANYKTLHSLDSLRPRCYPCIYDRFKQRFSYGVICGTTHDECAFRISLGLDEKQIIRLVKGCLYNMEQRFSPLFDGIPLRAQLAVSLTNAGEMAELDHRSKDFERKLLDEYIRPGKEKSMSK